MKHTEKHTEKTKKKIAESMSKYLKTHPEHGGLHYWKGKKHSEKTKRKMSLSSKKSNNSGRFKKGFKPWNTGIQRASINYKGTSVSGNHSFLKKWFGNPKKCQNCSKVGKKKNGRWIVEYALRKGCKYSENVKDYLTLCRKCHRNYDKELYRDAGRKKK